MSKLVWLNGEIMPLEAAQVSVADHAHLYGDGLFEGIRIYHGKVFKLDEHLQRLYFGIRYLDFHMTMTQQELRQTILDVCRQAQITDGYIRVNVTRGTGLGLDPSKIDPNPNVMIMISSLSLYSPEAVEKGLAVVTCSLRVMPPDCLDPRIKCIGRYAANILAKLEANRVGADEGLMLNTQGYIAECTGDNIFLVTEGRIRTPHPSCGILNGITRQTVMALARAEGYVVTEEVLTTMDVYEAEEAFLTGTAAEVIPMVLLDGRPIGTGVPGPITRKMIELFHAHTHSGVPFQSVGSEVAHAV